MEQLESKMNNPELSVLQRYQMSSGKEHQLFIDYVMSKLKEEPFMENQRSFSPEELQKKSLDFIEYTMNEYFSGVEKDARFQQRFSNRK
jgi:hypothetical protein